MSSKIIVVFLAAFTFVMSGCSSHTVKIEYQNSSRTIARDVASKVGSVTVFDRRGTPLNWLGAIRGGYGNPLKKLYLQGSAEEVVATAFVDALEARGFLSEAPEFDYQINVDLLKFDTSYYVNKEAHAHFEVKVTNRETGDVVLSKIYKTDNKRGGMGAGIFGSTDTLTLFAQQTLNENIDKTLNDPDFIALLHSKELSLND